MLQILKGILWINTLRTFIMNTSTVQSGKTFLLISLRKTLYSILQRFAG